MPDLNPLKFQVAIQDEATGQLNKIEQEFDKLKDKNITVTVNGLSQLESLLKLLGQENIAPKVGENVSADMEKATAALKKESEELRRLTEEAKVAASAITKLEQAQQQLSSNGHKVPTIDKVWGSFLGNISVPGGDKLEKAITDWWSHEVSEKMNISFARAAARVGGFSGLLDTETLETSILNTKKQIMESFSQWLSNSRGGKIIDGDTNFHFVTQQGKLYDVSDLKAMSEKEFQKFEQKTWEQQQKAAEKMLKEQFGALAAITHSDVGYLSTWLSDKGGLAALKKVQNVELFKNGVGEKPHDAMQVQVLTDATKHLIASENELAQTERFLETSRKAQSNIAQQIAAQEQKVAEAKERVAQVTQQQKQSASQNVQAEQKQAQEAKVSADAMQRLNEQYQQLAQGAIKTALDAFTKDLKAVKEAIQSDNFSAFSKRIETCAEKITLLDEAFKKFKVTIGENKELKDLLTGWGAAIKEVSAAMAAMNSVKNGGGAKAAQKEELRQQEEGLIRVANAMGRVRDAASGSGGASLGGVAFMESINKVGERNIQTLIKEQGHIERLIAIAKKSIDFGEGHPVLGMGRLRGDQMQNLQNLEQLKKIINEILYAANQGDQAAIRFLNTLGSLKTTPFGKDSMGNDITLLGGHFDKLTHSVTGTASAMRTLEREMRLDSNVWPNSEQDSNLRRYNQLLADAEKLLRRIDEAGAKGSKLGLNTSLSNVGARDVSNFIEKALKFNDVGNFRALNELIAQFQRLKNVYGDVAREQERMNSNTIKAGGRADAQYMKEVEQFTKQAINEYNQWQESIRRAGVEITNLKIKLKELEDIEKRGKNAGSDTTNLQARISALRQELSVLQEIHNGSKSYGFAKDYIKTEKYHETLKLAAEEGKAVQKNAQERERADGKAIKDLETIETNQRRYNQLLTDASNLQNRLSAASTKGNGLLLDTTKTETALQQLQQHIDKVLNFDSRNLRDNHAVNELIASWNALKNTLAGVVREQEKLNTATERANKKAQENSTKQAQKENEQWAESMRRAGVEATKLDIQVRKLQEAESKGQKAGINTAQLSARIAELQNYITILRSIEGGSKVHGHTSDFVNSAPVQNAIRLANEEASAVRRATTEKERASRVTQQLSVDEQRLAQALNQTTESARGQSQVLSDLKSLATQYLGVWGGQQFLNNIIQIGGQLEMQRLSIGAILQNQAQANDLFDKIKGLATQSPFGVVELDQMTKQLTAYGFKYNELFDMTKRLADISAATGTGVDRLALALGHVRSEAALSGYTLRQFAMGNVPMLQKLSEKLGKTTEEIRKMVRAKQISYDDVVGVLKDLTDEGGMFHNMQEVISQSVKAKFKNVKDAMDIMYGEMAEGDIGDALKEVAEVLMEVTQNWKDASTVLGTGTAMWALHRVAVLANIATLGEHNAATLKSIAAFRAQEAQQLRTASMYRVLSSAEKSQIATSKLLTVQERLRLALHIPLTSAQKLRIQYARQQMVMDQALAISEKKLTTEAIARQVATGKLTKAEAVQIITLADLTAAERIAALEAVNGTRKMNFFTMGLVNAGNAAMRLGAALKSIIFNPATLMMAGVTALVELWQKNNQEMERASELADTIRERSNASMMSNKRIIEGSQMEFRDSEGNKVSPSHLDFQSIAHIQATMSIKFDKQDAQRQIDEWADYIRQYSATPNSIINEALFDGDKLRPIEEQYNRIAAAVGEIVKAQYGLHDLGDIFENATRATDSGWFNDDVITNINEYEEAVKDYNRAFAELYKDHGAGVDKIVKAVEKQNSAFAESVSGMNTYAEKFRHLAENWDKYTGAYDIARNEVQYSDNKLYSKLYDLRFGFDEGQERNHSQGVMNEDLDIFFNHIEAEINNRGQKIGELTKAQQQDLLLGFTDFLGKTKVTTKETLDYLKKRFAERFMLTLDADDEKFQVKVNEVIRILKELSQSDWTVEMEFGSNVKDVIDEARKQYKAAKEYFEKVKPIMLKLGVEFEMGTELTEEQIEAAVAKAEPQAQEFVRNALRGVNEATKIYNNAMAASKAGGFALEDDKKKKKTGGTKAYQDEFAKRWDERIRIMKEAYGWYEKWEKKVGNDSAIAETNSKYGDIFREWKTDKVLPMDFDVTQIADYQRYVEKIRDDALARYQQQKNDKTKKNGEEALRVYRQAVALLNDIKFDNFVLAADQFKSTIDKTIDNLNTRWEMFNSVRTATGDEELAFTLSGLGLDENARNSAEAMKNELSKQLSDIGGQSLLDQVLFSSDYDEERVRKMFKNLIPDDSKAKIDGLVQAYVEWQKLQKQVLKADVNTFANLIGSAVDLQSQVVKINEEYKQIIETLDRLKNEGQINDIQYTRGVQIASANREMKLVEASASYKLLVDGVVTMNKKAAQQVKQDFVNAVTAQLRAGAITAKEYADKIADINKKMKKLENAPSDTRAYMQGGLNGLFQNMMQKGKSQYEEGAQMYQDAQKILDTSSDQQQIAQAFKDSDAAQSMMQMGEGMEAMGEGGMECVAIIDMIVHGIDNLVQGFNDAFQQIREMYTALGYDTESDSWEDANTFFSSFSSASSSAAKGWDSLKNGDVGGVISGVVGTFTGWITGFAKGHDKKRQNHIEALQRNVAALEANTEVIKSLRGRTLGYDTGALRRYFAKTYKGGDAASNAMREFYTTGSGASGYAQELAALEKERQDYVNMYNEEDDKKDSSDEALLEFKKKIAELDEQIHYFSEDLAKELWDIDIKGWADQLSDGLSTAFENGESAAKAYRETVTSILQQVMNKMMQMAILEPMFASLEEKLFGSVDKGTKGVFNAEDPKSSINATVAAITDFFGKGGDGEQAITAALEFANAFERGVSNAGLSVLNKDTANTLSSSVQGTSEETSGLLAAYLNACRQDVAIQRLLLNQFVTEMWPSYIEQVSGAVKSLSSIDQNVGFIRALLSENGDLYNMLASMRSHLDNITNGNEEVHVR